MAIQKKVKKPLTQRELRAVKKKASGDGEENMTVYNPSPRKMIPIQIRKPGSDFYVGEQTIRIGPYKRYTNKKNFFNADQITNLRAKGFIKVISG